MSSITTDQGIVHYEVFGRGKPVILLHGYQGSWGLWQETMSFLGAFYRTYALDFWGFGESGTKRSTYAVKDFVSLVAQFMEQLGIVRAPLVGHSMGGTVSLMTAIQHPDRVQKVAVIGSPISGSSLYFFPRTRHANAHRRTRIPQRTRLPIRTRGPCRGSVYTPLGRVAGIERARVVVVTIDRRTAHALARRRAGHP